MLVKVFVKTNENQGIRQNQDPQPEYGESADDEIIDGLVKAATVKSDQPREQRRKARQFSRKSLRRTRTLKLKKITKGPILVIFYTLGTLNVWTYTTTDCTAEDWLVEID
uniref:Uncharacterized protein n=1 Tax=Romanomermis culicivorax TaxID=13658 RepID=A0A915I747_ROMCU